MSYCLGVWVFWVAFVTERIGLGDVEAAFNKMHEGTVLRSVVEI